MGKIFAKIHRHNSSFFWHQTYPNARQYSLKLSPIYIAKIFLFNAEILFRSRSSANTRFFNGPKIRKYFARIPPKLTKYDKGRANMVKPYLFSHYANLPTKSARKARLSEKLRLKHGNSTGSVVIPPPPRANMRARHPKMHRTTTPRQKKLASHPETQTPRHPET